MSKRYKIFKNGLLVNTIIADDDYFRNPSDMWDSYEELVDPIVIPAPMPEPIIEKIVTPVAFKLLFNSQERISIKNASLTDPVIEDFYSIIDDVRCTQINLLSQTTKDFLDHLVSINLITEIRKEAILTGIPL